MGEERRETPSLHEVPFIACIRHMRCLSRVVRAGVWHLSLSPTINKDWGWEKRDEERNKSGKDKRGGGSERGKGFHR